jgi:hypothetical protein
MKQYSLRNKMVETKVGVYALILPTWLKQIEHLTCSNDNTMK